MDHFQWTELAAGKKIILLQGYLCTNSAGAKFLDRNPPSNPPSVRQSAIIPIPPSSWTDVMTKPGIGPISGLNARFPIWKLQEGLARRHGFLVIVLNSRLYLQYFLVLM
jgi:hypothetical protein